MKLPDYVLIFTLALALALSFSIGKGFQSILSIAGIALGYLISATPFMILGFVLGGLSQEFIPKEIFLRELGGLGPGTCVKAAAMGIFVDVCSHGALAIAVSLYRSGASVAAVTAFLLATPWLGIMETSLLVGLLGWKITIVMAVLSFVLAVLTGTIIGFLEKRGLIETHKQFMKKVQGNSIEELKVRFKGFQWESFPHRFRSSLGYSFELLEMIWKWLFVGFTAAGITVSFVNPAQIEGLMGYASATALPVTLAIASMIEICSEGSVPLAAAFYNMGASIGALFVFLMAGVMSDVTEIGTIYTTIGKRAAGAIVGISISATLLFGYSLNWLWFSLGFV